MKQKSIEKLFELAYKDAMTGLYNRTAYEEYLDRLRKTGIENITVMVTEICSLQKIKGLYGQHTADEAVKIISQFLIHSMQEKANIYRISENTFVCISEKDISNNIYVFKGLAKLEAAQLDYPFEVITGSRSYSGELKDIDAVIKECDRIICQNRKNF